MGKVEIMRSLKHCKWHNNAIASFEKCNQSEALMKIALSVDKKERCKIKIRSWDKTNCIQNKKKKQ